MSEELEKRYILSVRCIDLRSPIPGVTKQKCMRCGELCWVSPSLQNEKVDGVMCTHCITDSDKEDEVNFILKPEVEEEFLRWKAEHEQA